MFNAKLPLIFFYDYGVAQGQVPPLYTPVVTGDGDRCVVQGNGSNISVYRAILFSVQIFLPKIFSVLILG